MPLNPLEFETGQTVQFTWQSSVAPDAAPTLVIKDGPASAIASISAIQSDSTHYWAPFTMPGTPEQHYVAEWTALKTLTSPASTFDFVKREGFKVVRTDPLT